MDPPGYFGGIAAGPDGGIWFTNSLQEFRGGKNYVSRAPACALGLSATISGAAPDTKFDLGIDRPAHFSILLGDAIGLGQSVPPVVLPRAFILHWDAAAFSGDVPVKSELSTSGGEAVCAEWTTVKAAQ
jgi:hypothetical protein